MNDSDDILGFEARTLYSGSTITCMALGNYAIQNSCITIKFARKMGVIYGHRSGDALAQTLLATYSKA